MSKLTGNNEIRLNHASMRIAVQHYLNTQMLSAAAAAEVTHIDYVSNCHDFILKVKPLERPAPEDPTR